MRPGRNVRQRSPYWFLTFVGPFDGQDSLLLGVADRPMLESEYTFHKTLLE